MISITLPQWLTLTSLPPLGIIAVTLVIGYVLFEVAFFFHYEWQLVPRANRISSRPPAPYRDYSNVEDRGKLLLRILDRLGERIPARGDNINDAQNITDKKVDAASDIYYNFIESWFQKKREDVHYEKFSEQFDMATLDGGLCPPPPAMMRMAWSSLGRNASTDDDSNKSSRSSDSLLALDGESSNGESDNIMQKKECNDIANDNETINHEKKKLNTDRIQKGNMNDFLSWAFFGVPFSAVQSTPSVQTALDDLYIILQTRTGLSFEPGSNPNYKPRSFTFEEVKSMYRPFFVYASVALMRMIANCILFVMGFRQYSCKRGLVYWHRPAKQRRGGPPIGSPFLFFHGIAPGGYAPYLPMIFFGILKDQLSHQYRDVFLFENKPVSYALCFEALSEEDTIQGVLEAIQTHLASSPSGNSLTLCGHSFGSCQLTWMSKAPEIKNRIRALILIDPVTILLSEPDVVVNFLYTRHELEDSRGNSNSWSGRLIRFFNETKIQLVASSEMFIEYYLRRNFAWYNSEIWLQDIPNDVNVVVCLAERDEIVNTSKIEMHLACHNSRVSREVSERISSDGPLIETIIWKDVGHAHCVSNPERWSDIHHALRKIESQTQK
mmetsp:Transcript_6558/g.12671  ORF Transcript_6558/g.12671 Transcript_6558/m.12671 type:complete len:610 (-) Transcript_6558:261-2090(-)|eukprot:CAMPEP_0196151878 /NCGR_PEP_ID=MMETSP0910-20130528/34451_1 /TAXON_ID=49265 /ORGANISM="Thalassiosira rotula, Strain GSO102" /LENGTH=609 /DNA_ID=CAMNT_0041415343 /DNA_START=13 /DNA_END=1842 /DNA_ORIENTATION=-